VKSDDCCSVERRCRQSVVGIGLTALSALLGAAVLIAAVSRAGAAPTIYVTSEFDSAVAIVDGELDAMVGAVRLSVGTADLHLGAAAATAYVLDEASDQLVVADLASGAIMRRIAVGAGPRRMAVDGDERFAYVTGDPPVQVDLATGTVRAAVEGRFVRDVALSPDGATAYFSAVFSAMGADAGLSIVDVVSGETRTAAPDFWARGVAVSPDGRVVYLAGNRPGRAEGRLLIIDAETLDVLGDSRLSNDSLDQVLVSPDGTALYLLISGDVNVVDPATGGLRHRIDAPFPLERMTVTPDGARMYATYRRSLRNPFDVAVIDLAARRLTAELSVGAVPAALSAAAGGDRIYIAALDGLYAVDTTSHAATQVVAGAVDPTGIAASPDGRMLYVAGTASENVAVVDTEQRRLIATLPTGGMPLGVVVTPDGTRVYASSFTVPGRVSVIDTASREIIDQIEVPGRAGGIAVTPDGSRVLVSNFDNALMSVIDTATGNVTHGGIGASPRGIAISRDGRVGVAAVDLPSGLRFFDAQTLRLGPAVDVSPGAASWPCGVAMSADGRHAYSTQNNGADVQLVGADPARVLVSRNIAAPYSTSSCGIALSPDESRVYVANHDNDLVTVLAGDDLALIHHIPVLRRPYELAIACMGGCSTAPATPTATPLRSPTPARACAGDCEGDGTVTVADLIRATSVALDRAGVAACPAADGNRDGRVTIRELIAAVTAALGGCPQA
jgi:YVTN family beta-propeller protein